MKNGKFAKRGVASKTLVLILALVLVIGVSVGGTLAWLTASTSEVKNTFTTSDVDITLAETTGDSYKMVPGYTIKKNPKATVLTGSEECWLFVEITKANDFDKYMTYELATGWTAGKGTEGEGVDGIPTNVVYRKVETANIGTAYSVLKDDQVTVLGTVTKEMMEAAETKQPTLTFKAYASQLMQNADTEFTAAEAWANVDNPSGATK